MSECRASSICCFQITWGNRTGRAKLEMAEEQLVSETQGIRHMNYKILMAHGKLKFYTKMEINVLY